MNEHPEREQHLTITGFDHYYGTRPFALGNLIRCCKEPSNPHDHEAICCRLPFIGTVGYVANSAHTVAGGTLSAGRLYDKVPRQFYARVLFTTHSQIICRVELCDSALDREFAQQAEWENDPGFDD